VSHNSLFWNLNFSSVCKLCCGVTLLHCIGYKTPLQGGGKGGSFTIYFKGISCDPPEVTSNGVKLCVVAQELVYFRG
jgi:hypothetical protein